MYRVYCVARIINGALDPDEFEGELNEYAALGYLLDSWRISDSTIVAVFKWARNGEPPE